MSGSLSLFISLSHFPSALVIMTLMQEREIKEMLAPVSIHVILHSFHHNICPQQLCLYLSLPLSLSPFLNPSS